MTVALIFVLCIYWYGIFSNHSGKLVQLPSTQLQPSFRATGSTRYGASDKMSKMTINLSIWAPKEHGTLQFTVQQEIFKRFNVCRYHALHNISWVHIVSWSIHRLWRLGIRKQLYNLWSIHHENHEIGPLKNSLYGNRDSNL